MTIRLGTVADADGVAEAHVRSWQVAYRGHLPDPFLDALSVERRAGFWRSFIAAGRPGEHLFVVVEEDTVRGFAHAGLCRDEAIPAGTGEISSIYLVPEVWGTGLGRALMQTCVDQLAEDGHHEVVLWVLVTNARARRFYEAAGWTCDEILKTEEMAGTTVTETRYRRPL